MTSLISKSDVMRYEWVILLCLKMGMWFQLISFCSLAVTSILKHMFRPHLWMAKQI